MEAEPIQIDGRTLEGGGQLLRLALSLACLFRVPVELTHIRGRRGSKSDSSKVGGMKPAHLAGAQWLAKVIAAHTDGMEVRSTKLLFRPPRSEPNPVTSIWKDIFDQGDIVRRETCISMSTPGSIALILQTILPHLLFGMPSSLPLRVKIEGGTNVSKSPSIDYVIHVLFPLLQEILEIQKVGISVHRRGWSAGRSSVGCVSFDIVPVTAKSISAFQISRRTPVVRIDVILLASGIHARAAIRAEVVTRLQAILPAVNVKFVVEEDSGDAKRAYLMLVAETDSRQRLGSDGLYEAKRIRCRDKRKGGEHVDPLDELKNWVVKVTENLQAELAHGGGVDQFMQDQIVVFQALVRGRAEVDTGSAQATLHTLTVRWVVSKLLDLKFDDEGHCDGVGFPNLCPGGPHLEATVRDLERLDLGG